MSFFHILSDFLFSAIATGAFGVVFNIPRREIICTSILGAVGWTIYIVLFKDFGMETAGVFIGAIIVALFSRILSYRRLIPSTIYLIPAIIPLVPGTEMYYIAEGLLKNDMYYTFTHTVRALKFAGVIAIAILLIYSMRDKYFYLFRKKNL